ncbi:response regulator transcription factor [Pseudazoarcus pumilus]|uniref:DNA-binding response regulator n=1 Tax=Pseudazoarcus pumilus TaxID=2067960 RepID=A0A2I6S626_9RHOO|nr:response regulator transcription factor [Pseudazoarcus pumilus]AUN94688.1 DNA-binding response regulator [Pseudazoarcus pumilus]
MPTRVLIVEDQSALAANLEEFFDAADYTLDFAADGLTALHLLATQQYDVVVLDVMLPAVSGFEICRRIREDLRSKVPVIFMTARGQLNDKEEGFGVGGDDYLVKPFALRELQLRIDALARRDTGGRDGVLHAGRVSFDPDTLIARVAGRGEVMLGGTAARIFERLVREHPRIVTHEALSTAIWGTDDGDPHTLRTHIYVLRRTLDAAFGASLVDTVHGRGYRLVEPPDAP